MRADKEKMHSMKKADVSPKDRSALLADTLRRYRLAAGFSQQSVAAAIGISRSAYTYYETGKTSPDPTTLNRIAKIFDVPLEVFFQEEGHTDGARFRDPGAKPRRAPKKIKVDPQKVGGADRGRENFGGAPAQPGDLRGRRAGGIEEVL